MTFVVATNVVASRPPERLPLVPIVFNQCITHLKKTRYPTINISHTYFTFPNTIHLIEAPCIHMSHQFYRTAVANT